MEEKKDMKYCSDCVHGFEHANQFPCSECIGKGNKMWFLPKEKTKKQVK